MKIKNILSTIFIPILFLLWIWFSRVPQSSLPSYELAAPQRGFAAPDFTLTGLDGNAITLSALKGRPIILNFWASWCPPCRAEMPAFQEVWQEYRNTDLVILAVNASHQDSQADILSFLNQHQLEFPILLDQFGSASSLYQIHSLPTTFLINRQGIIDKTLIGGPIPLSLLRVEADRLLEENFNDPSN